MDRVYRVVKWDEIYECAESRRVNNLSWVAWPIDLDSAGYDLMVEHFGHEAPAIYGAWCALVCVAAKGSPGERGVLSDSKGRPYSMGRLARKAHFPVEVFEKMVAWASSEDVAWLEFVACPEHAQGAPVACPTKIQPRGDGDETETTLERPSVRPSRDAGENTVIVVSEENFTEIHPTIERIARVVTGNKNVIVGKLKAADRTLAYRAAALARWRYGEEWLGDVLTSISARSSLPDKPWGFFRGALRTAAREQFDEELRDAEKLVVNQAKSSPTPTGA